MTKYLSLTTEGSFENIIDALEDLRVSLHEKSETFVRRLLEIGVDTAESNCGDYHGMIVFKHQVEPNDNGCDGVLIATDGQKVVREWRYKGTIKSVEVSPLLMAEFGSGWLAEVLDTVEGVGQGTFPGQKHAFDKNGWSWTTPDNEFHRSKGEAPTFPMHKAMLEMEFEIDRIGSEVFGNG
jgi:hypothetical protein